VRELLEPFDPRKHDSDRVASLLWRSDPEFNALVYGPGEEGTKVLRALLDRGTSYFAAPHLRCAVLDGDVVGVVSSHPVRDRRRLGRAAGAAFMATFGGFGFLKRLPTLLRLGAILRGTMPREATYVVYLCVAEEFRRKGIGRVILEELGLGTTPLALHVSGRNVAAIAFYEALGFRASVRHAGTADGDRHDAIMMLCEAPESHLSRPNARKL